MRLALQILIFFTKVHCIVHFLWKPHQISPMHFGAPLDANYQAREKFQIDIYQKFWLSRIVPDWQIPKVPVLALLANTISNPKILWIEGKKIRKLACDPFPIPTQKNCNNRPRPSNMQLVLLANIYKHQACIQGETLYKKIPNIIPRYWIFPMFLRKKIKKKCGDSSIFIPSFLN